MYMPLMVDIRKTVVFGGERDEGLQKTEKMAVFADEILVVPETRDAPNEITLESGDLERVPESLSISDEVSIPVATEPATEANISEYIEGADFVTSDLEDFELNQQIYEKCDDMNILCNIIDVKKLCDTWFMSVIDTPNMIAGLSTKGGCAFYSQRTRIELEDEFEVRSEVSRVFTQLRDNLSEDQCNLCALDIIYRDDSMQEHIDNERWDEALETGRTLIDEIPGNFHVMNHAVNGLEEDT